MHPCLRVDEILRHIASELVASEGEASAVALACCCKSFEDPVLDALWETQEGLTPMLKTLPENVWINSERGVGAPTIFVLCWLNYLFPQFFRRPPTKGEWARFRAYARRIRWFQEHGSQLPPSQALLVLQFRPFGEPLLPNLKSLILMDVTENLVPFIPLFLSPRITSIELGFKLNFPDVVAASVVATFPTVCPNLQRISLHPIPRDPMIATAISEMLLVTNRNTLQQLEVYTPLTEEASKVICKLPNLRKLRLGIYGSDPLPTLVLPNLARIHVEYDDGHGWLQGFRGATLGELTSVAFYSVSHSIGDFLEAFESVALTTSIPATLSKFTFHTLRGWRPNYRSLLPFTQLKQLIVRFSCARGCSSMIDDHTITELARAMPKLEFLRFGNLPCKTPTGVTAKGLTALAYHCPRLSSLCVHFQVAGLDPSEIPQATSCGEPTILREDCALTCLQVGNIYVPEKSTLMVALTLLRIFPRLDDIMYIDQGWEKVADAISASKKLVDHSSKKHPFDAPRRNVDDTPFRSHS